MKFLIAILFISSVANAQSSKSFSIPMVKESPAVDAMVQNFKDYTKWIGLENDSCFIIDIYSDGKDALYSIHYLDSTNRSNLFTNRSDIFKKTNYKYFRFKNNFVLVYGDKDPYALFEQTKDILFLNLTQIQEIKGTTRKDEGYLYVYKKGKFRVLGDLRK